MISQAPVKLLEKHVTEQVKSYLEFRGWRLIRHNVTKVQSVYGQWTQFGENGMPDYLALKYLPDGVSLHLWLEFKRLKGKLEAHQIAWHNTERLRGAIVWRVDEIKSFIVRYEAQFGWVHTEDWISGQKDLLLDADLSPVAEQEQVIMPRRRAK